MEKIPTNYQMASQLLENFGLEIITKPYLLNKSIQVFDPLTKRYFSITQHGYFRTHKISKWGNHITYPLNPLKPKCLPSKMYPFSRLLYPGQYYFMAHHLIKSIKNIRKLNNL